MRRVGSSVLPYCDSDDVQSDRNQRRLVMSSECSRKAFDLESTRVVRHCDEMFQRGSLSVRFAIVFCGCADLQLTLAQGMGRAAEREVCRVVSPCGTATARSPAVLGTFAAEELRALHCVSRSAWRIARSTLRDRCAASASK